MSNYHSSMFTLLRSGKEILYPFYFSQSKGNIKYFFQHYQQKKSIDCQRIQLFWKISIWENQITKHLHEWRMFHFKIEIAVLQNLHDNPLRRRLALIRASQPTCRANLLYIAITSTAAWRVRS